MVHFLAFIPLFLHFLLLMNPSSSLPLCTDLREPLISKTPLTFCPYNGSVCCDSSKDLQLKNRFRAMNISDSGCASLVKSILCATCDQFSAELFKVESGRPRPVPVLCNSAMSVNSSLSNRVESSFCSSVWDVVLESAKFSTWDACQNVSISDSPFSPSTDGTATQESDDLTPTKLAELWDSKTIFCNALGGSSDDGSICFDGQPVSLDQRVDTQLPPNGLCLEKVGNGSYLNMVAHPDGSNRAFFSNQEGKIWLASVPGQDSGETLELDESIPFIDLMDQVHCDGNSFGMMGIAFHPNFARNGRFFASFSCDKLRTPGCSGRCSCNSNSNCDPLNLASSTAAEPCRYHKVVAEFTANGTASEPSMAKLANPSEVRRILTMGLPFAFSQGGQILFGPADGYLYIMIGTGYGVKKDDPYQFAQNKKVLLGKILRLDVDNIPSTAEIGESNQWGSYSVPQDNPYSEDKEFLPEIWALGLRNPWRCSFDSQRPLYFICADAGQDQYEEVDIITKGGNYGWSVYEGPNILDPEQSPERNASANSINPSFPILGYKHSDVNNDGSASITGGHFYRSATDPCMYGSYLYADLYGSDIWAAAENPINSGKFTSINIPFRCSPDSPILLGSPSLDLGYIYSFGEDNRKDIFILTSSGVYRVVRPSRCCYTCLKETVAAVLIPSTPPSSCENQLTHSYKLLIILSSLFSFWLMWIPV